MVAKCHGRDDDKSRSALTPIPTAAAKPDCEETFSAWVLYQANELRTLKPIGIGWEHVAQELEEMAARIRHALVSDLEVVLLHLLKLQFETTAFPNPSNRRPLLVPFGGALIGRAEANQSRLAQLPSYKL